MKSEQCKGNKGFIDPETGKLLPFDFVKYERLMNELGLTGISNDGNYKAFTVVLDELSSKWAEGLTT